VKSILPNPEPGVPRLLLVRHRQSTWNDEGRWTGQADPPLSEHGEREALELGGVLAPVGFAAVVSSDLCRARRTAELIGTRLGSVPVTEDPRLREIDVPAWTGRTKAEIRLRYPAEYEAWRSGDRRPPPGSEAWEEFERRVVAALHDAAERGPTVLVVAHSGVLRAAGSALGAGGKVGRSKARWLQRQDGSLAVGPVVRVAPSERRAPRPADAVQRRWATTADGHPRGC
jgi:probable phosphoglycerate mutase